MLILREDIEGVWITHKIRGQEIQLKIRPLTAEIGDAIRKKHKKIEYVRDPQTRQMIKTEVINQDAVFDDLVDHVLEDFKGIGIAPDQALPVTKENKKRVIFLPTLANEQPLWDFILEKANELAVIVQEDKEKEIKNS